MKSTTYPMPMRYTFDPNHSGAHYTFDGVKFHNNGDFCEMMLKAALGYKAEKDGNGRYDKTSDIIELKASVKSEKATIVNMKLGKDFESWKRYYFDTVHSTLFVYVTHTAEELTAYYMNAEEFENFIDAFGYWEKHRETIRLPRETKAMIRWLDERAN